MCGIVGMRRFDGQPPEEETLRAMASTLAHRGPDGEGFLVRGTVGLGHRRLSIIDLAHSVQPMSGLEDTLHVCFNGEILNYRELRAATRYPYVTEGDTEVLLATHAALGADGVERLRGQFAYALYDERSDELWLHRDRLGILPLYYYVDSQVFVFASEIKAMLPALPRRPDVDPAGVADYLARRSVPAPWTLFEGIRKVEPGTSMCVDREGVSSRRRYWSIPEAGGEQHMTDHMAVSSLRSSLTSAVERCMVADVPVGAYLSGGLDSSLIVALMAQREGGRAVETFSAGFAEPGYDELPYARRVSEVLGTVHHEVRVTAEDFRQLWEPLTWHRDAPISEASDVAVYRLAELARTRVKVVLSGEGSDELFGGYPKHRYARMTQAAGLFPAGPRRSVAAAIERAMPARLARPRIAVRALGERTAADRMEAWFAPFTAAERAALLRGHLGHDRHPSTGGQGDALRRMLVADASGWLSDNLLERGDRMSMAASLELRPPFLDADVVDLAFSMPSRVKVRGSEGKWVVRELARDLLPEADVSRPKVGFSVPLSTWFRTGLQEMAKERLLDDSSVVSQLLDRRMVESLLTDHERGRRNEEQRIWTLLSLDVWHRLFFGARSQPSGTLTAGSSGTRASR